MGRLRSTPTTPLPARCLLPGSSPPVPLSRFRSTITTLVMLNFESGGFVRGRGHNQDVRQSAKKNMFPSWYLRFHEGVYTHAPLFVLLQDIYRSSEMNRGSNQYPVPSSLRPPRTLPQHLQRSKNGSMSEIRHPIEDTGDMNSR